MAITPKQSNKNFESFGEGDSWVSSLGNTISFECVVPEDNSEDVLEGITKGFAKIGLFKGIK